MQKCELHCEHWISPWLNFTSSLANHKHLPIRYLPDRNKSEACSRYEQFLIETHWTSSSAHTFCYRSTRWIVIIYICYMRLVEWVWWWSFMRQYRDVSELCAALDFTWIRAHIVSSGRPTHRPDVFILAINSMLILLLFAYVRCSYGRAHLNEQPTTKAFLLCLFCWSRWENKKKKKKTTQSSVVNRFLNAVNGDIKTYSFSSYTLFSSLNYKNILSRREFMHARRWEINFNCTECDGCECWCSGIGQHANVHVFRTFNCNRTNRWWNSKTKNLEYRASLQPSEPLNRIW